MNDDDDMDGGGGRAGRPPGGGDPHRHGGFEPPAGNGGPVEDPLFGRLAGAALDHPPFGRLAGAALDDPLLGPLAGAVLDFCQSCREALLALLAQDPPACARLVELACAAVRDGAGRLPRALTGAGSRCDPRFRRLARACEDGDDAMFAECARMGADGRLAAAHTAADVLVGVLLLRAAPARPPARGGVRPPRGDGGGGR